MQCTSDWSVVRRSAREDEVEVSRDSALAARPVTRELWVWLESEQLVPARKKVILEQRYVYVYV